MNTHFDNKNTLIGFIKDLNNFKFNLKINNFMKKINNFPNTKNKYHFRSLLFNKNHQNIHFYYKHQN